MVSRRLSSSWGSICSQQNVSKDLLRDSRTWTALAAVVKAHPQLPWYVLSDTPTFRSYAEERLVRVGARLGSPLPPCAARGSYGQGDDDNVEGSHPSGQRASWIEDATAMPTKHSNASLSRTLWEKSSSELGGSGQREATTRAVLRDFFTLNTAAGVVAIAPLRASGILKGHGESSFATVAALAGDAPLLMPAPSTDASVLAFIEAQCRRPLRGIFYLDDLHRYIQAVSNSSVRLRVPRPSSYAPLVRRNHSLRQSGRAFRAHQVRTSWAANHTTRAPPGISHQISRATNQTAQAGRASQTSRAAPRRSQCGGLSQSERQQNSQQATLSVLPLRGRGASCKVRVMQQTVQPQCARDPAPQILPQGAASRPGGSCLVTRTTLVFSPMIDDSESVE